MGAGMSRDDMVFQSLDEHGPFQRTNAASNRTSGGTDEDAVEPRSKPEHGQALMGHSGEGSRLQRCTSEGGASSGASTLSQQSSQDPGFEPVQEESQDKGKMAVEGMVGDAEAQLGIEDRLKLVEVQLREVQADLQEQKRQHSKAQSELQKEVDTLKKKVDGLTKENEILEQELQVVKKQLQRELEDKAKLKQENDELRQSCSDFEDRNNKLTKKNDELMAQVQLNKQEIGRLQKALADKEKDLYKYKKKQLGASVANGELHGTDEQDDQAHTLLPPPPYDDLMLNAANSVEALSLEVGPGQTLSVQGPFSHDQPPLQGSRPPNLTDAPLPDQEGDLDHSDNDSHDKSAEVQP